METERSHGKWIDMAGKTESDKPFIAYGKGYFMCDVCKSILWLSGKDAYCRKCGSRMDVTENDE